jgi:hypothetical protein
LQIGCVFEEKRILNSKVERSHENKELVEDKHETGKRRKGRNEVAKKQRKARTKRRNGERKTKTKGRKGETENQGK